MNQWEWSTSVYRGSCWVGTEPRAIESLCLPHDHIGREKGKICQRGFQRKPERGDSLCVTFWYELCVNKTLYHSWGLHDTNVTRTIANGEINGIFVLIWHRNKITRVNFDKGCPRHTRPLTVPSLGVNQRLVTKATCTAPVNYEEIDDTKRHSCYDCASSLMCAQVSQWDQRHCLWIVCSPLDAEMELLSKNGRAQPGHEAYTFHPLSVEPVSPASTVMNTQGD